MNVWEADSGEQDQLVPQDHPIRKIKPIVDRALEELSFPFDVLT